MIKSQVWPFVAPFLLFMVILTVEGYLPDQHYVIYPFKAILVALVIAWFGRAMPSLTPSAPVFSILIGIAGVVLWVGLDPWAMKLNAWLMHGNVVPQIGRNPFALYPEGWAWALFGFRLLGIALVVPIMEELFWRGFLMRWLIKDDFASVSLGTYQPYSFFVTTALFASVHGSEWFLAVVVGLIYGYWFVRTKRLGDIMLAHGVTNLLLALYCLFSGDWHFLSTVTPPR